MGKTIIQIPEKQVIEVIDLKLKNKVHNEILEILDKYQIQENISLEILENIVFDIRLDARLCVGDEEDV